MRSAGSYGAALLILSSCLAAGAAPPSPEERAQAEALFREGKALGEAGNLQRACLKFEESQKLDPALGTLLHLAACYETEGKTASAWGAFEAAATLAEGSDQPERAELARARAAKLEATLNRLVITRASRSIDVALDGRVLGPGSFSTPLPVDPGTHYIEAMAPGKKPWRRQIDLAAASARLVSIRVPLLDGVPPMEVSSPKPPTRRQDDPSPEPAPRRWPGFVVGGAGLFALGVGGYFGVRAAMQQKDADRHCDGTECTQAGLDGHAEARVSAWIANVGVALGLVGVGTGTYLLVSRAPQTSSTQEAQGIHVQLRGSF